MYANELQRLIRVNTVSGYSDTGGFPPFVAALKETFPKLFDACSVEDFDGSLLIRWKGSADGQPIMFMNHQDTVAAQGNWKYPLFSGEIAEGRLWGRGTLDTKGGLYCMLRAAEELISEGFLPRKDIYFESSRNEETTGSGADAISRELERRKIRLALCLDEGGMMMYDPVGCADGTFAMVGMGEKGCADLRFSAHSGGGHASTPGKNTPLIRLAKFMAAAESSHMFNAHLSETAAVMFERMSPATKMPLRAILRHPRFFRPLLSAVVPRISPATNAMFRTTLAFTTCKGSDSLNAIPSEAYVTGNMRFSHHQGREKSIAAVSALAKKFGVETEIIEPGFESSVAPCDSREFSLVSNAVSAVFPGVITLPYICNGASDSRFFTRICDNCMRFVPFLIDEQQLESIHGADENVSVSCLEPAVRFYKYIMEGMNNE